MGALTLRTKVITKKTIIPLLTLPKHLHNLQTVVSSARQPARGRGIYIAVSSYRLLYRVDVLRFAQFTLRVVCTTIQLHQRSIILALNDDVSRAPKVCTPFI